MLGNALVASPDAPAGSIVVLALAVATHVTASAMFVAGFPQFAVLHAYAAFVVLAVVAASHQLVPVLFQVKPLPIALTMGTAVAFCVGFALLVAGFCGLSTMHVAGVVLAIAASVWVVAVLSRLVTARSDRRMAITFGFSIASFGVAVGLGATMLWRWTIGIPNWMPPAHATLMLIAFASILIVTLSIRFVPMFALAHGDRYGSRVGILAAIAAAVTMATGVSLRASLWLLFAAMVVLGIQHVATMRTRLRKKIDMSLIYGACAWSIGIIAILTAIVKGQVDVASVCLALMGWIAITIFGYAMKILGFLSWQFARERGARQLAPLSAAIPEPAAKLALVALVAGTLGTAATFAWDPGLARAYTTMYLIGSLAYLGVFVRISSHYIFAVRTK